MKIIRYRKEAAPEYGILEDDFVYRLEGNVYGDFQKGEPVGWLESVALLAPCEPRQITSIGANYESRCLENNLPIPSTPGEGDKFRIDARVLTGTGTPVYLPTHENKLDWSGEMGIVIKKRCHNVSVEEAYDYILGYTALQNIWAKGIIDIQFDVPQDPRNQRIRAYETTCPTGPFIETELKDPMNIKWQTRVNGEVKQEASTADMLFNIGEMISDVSKMYDMEPGHIIQTGTASGVGPMKHGDRMEVEFEGLGVLKNVALDREGMIPLAMVRVRDTAKE